MCACNLNPRPYLTMTETQTSLSLSKEEGGYYNSIYALQLGLLTVLPLFLKMTVDRGVRDGLEYTMSTLMQGSWAFNIFTMATKAGARSQRALTRLRRIESSRLCEHSP